MKMYNLPYLSALLFLIATAFLYLEVPNVAFIYIVLMTVAFLPIATYKHDWKNRLLFPLIIGSISLYILLYKRISLISFWGDELMIIKYVQGTALYAISGSKAHIQVPPIDYLNLWLFNYTLGFLKSYISLEFFYRIPYMIYHVAASCIFSKLCTLQTYSTDKNTDQQKKVMLIGTTAFAIYFFNPILFWYSLEVKYVALACVGIVLNMYLYEKKLYFNPIFLPLFLFFSLVSLFEYLYIMAFSSVVFLLDKTKRLTIILYGCYFTSLYFISKPFLVKFPTVTLQQSLQQIYTVISSLFLKQFSVIQWILIGILIGISIFNKGIRKKLAIYIIIFIGCINISISLNIYNNYFDYNIRHVAFAVPILLFVIISAMSTLKGKLFYIFIILANLTIVIPWAISTINSIHIPQLSPTKPASDMLQIINRVTLKGKIYVVPITDETKNWPYYSMEAYGLIKKNSNIIMLSKSIIACEKILEDKNSFLLSYSVTPHDCSNFFDQKNEIVQGGYLISRK